MAELPVSSKFARLVSNVFIPPVFSAFIFLVLACRIEQNNKMFAAVSAVLFGLVLPFVIFFIFYFRGKVADLDATIKEERTSLYFAGILNSLLAAFLAYYFDLNDLIYQLWVIYSVNIIILLIINLYWKISAHTIGASIAAAVFLILFGIPGLLFLIIPALTGWSRLTLKKHTPAQVAAGFLFGYFSTLLQLYIFSIAA